MTHEVERRGLSRTWVLAAFAGVNLAMVAVVGVQMGEDSTLYVDGARALLSGEGLEARQPSYLGYISLVALAEWLRLGLFGLVVMQVAAATLAAAVVYRIAAELAGPLAGVLSVVLLTLDAHSNRWHAYVLSDSIYTSMLVVAARLAYQPGTKPAAAAVLGVAALVRPEGWFLIPAVAIFWVWRDISRPALRWVSLAGVAACGASLVLLVAPRLSGNLQAVGPGEMLRSGQTIWDYGGLRLQMPDEPVLDAPGGSAGRAVAYAVKHPVSTLTLMAARLGVHVAHVRPFYSLRHNLLILLWLLPVYGLGVYGWSRLRQHPLVRWCLVVIATQALVVALTHADWDGRYLAHVLPLWYPLAACGLVMVVPGRRRLPATEGVRG